MPSVVTFLLSKSFEEAANLAKGFVEVVVDSLAGFMETVLDLVS